MMTKPEKRVERRCIFSLQKRTKFPHSVIFIYWVLTPVWTFLLVHLSAWFWRKNTHILNIKISKNVVRCTAVRKILENEVIDFNTFLLFVFLLCQECQKKCISVCHYNCITSGAQLQSVIEAGNIAWYVNIMSICQVIQYNVDNG